MDSDNLTLYLDCKCISSHDLNRRLSKAGFVSLRKVKFWGKTGDKVSDFLISVFDCCEWRNTARTRETSCKHTLEFKHPKYEGIHWVGGC